MARRRPEIEIDDIELLNVYRYPEAYSASLITQLRNSKDAQRRLEELLRTMPEFRKKKGSTRPPESVTGPTSPAAIPAGQQNKAGTDTGAAGNESEHESSVNRSSQSSQNKISSEFGQGSVARIQEKLRKLFS